MHEKELRDKYGRIQVTDNLSSEWNYYFKRAPAQHLNILSGSMLGIYLKIKSIFGANKNLHQKLKICRVYRGANKEKRAIGINIPEYLMGRVQREINDLVKK